MSSNRPPFIELKLTSPVQKNDTVAWLQQTIIDNSPKYVRGLEPTGVFDKQTGDEVEAFFYRLGRPGPSAPAVGPGGLSVIWNRYMLDMPMPDAWQATRLMRTVVPFSLRKGISETSWRLMHPNQFPPASDLSAGLEVSRGWAARGYREDPSGSNYVPALSRLGFDLGVRANFASMRYAWCAYAFYLAHLKAGSPTAKAGLVDGRFWPLYCPTLANYADKGLYGHRTVRREDAKPGMGVLFNFDADVAQEHMGMFIEYSDGQIVTSDGNSSIAGSQSNGGMCVIRRRSAALVSRIYTIS